MLTTTTVKGSLWNIFTNCLMSQKSCVIFCVKYCVIISPLVKRGRSVMLTTRPHLVPRLRMSRSYTSSHPMPLFLSYVRPEYFTFISVNNAEAYVAMYKGYCIMVKYSNVPLRQVCQTLCLLRAAEKRGDCSGGHYMGGGGLPTFTNSRLKLKTHSSFLCLSTNTHKCEFNLNTLPFYLIEI
jgi:hypothetical protein